jgi:aminoglycoside 2''-phosphotransferase
VTPARRRISARRARAEIARAFPGLPLRDLSFLGAGVDSDAYLVDEQWVFRFPKRAAVARALGREVALLPKLAPLLPVAAPRFDYVGRQAGRGRLFAGYRLIPGEPLTSELYRSLSHPDQERALAALAALLRAVHAFPVADAVSAGVEALSTRRWVGSGWSGRRARVLPLLAPRDGAALTSLIERFLADARSFAEPPRLLHADLSPEHILYDADAGNVVGVIDWGDLAIGDPDFDLMYLRQDYGEDFVRRLLDHYPHPEPARLLEKLRVFDACDHLRTIAAAGRDPAERAAADEALAALGQILAQDLLDPLAAAAIGSQGDRR